MGLIERVEPRWQGQSCIVVATGPSLTPEVIELCAAFPRVIAVNDAYRVLPNAPILYACDRAWWNTHKGARAFNGERWSTHSPRKNEKLSEAKRFGINVLAGKIGTGFSLDPSVINYGSNSGFQATNLALLFGATRILLVAFDMRMVDGQHHYFGNHPYPLRTTSHYLRMIENFDKAAKALPKGITIINCTPESALTCFPIMPLKDALDGIETRHAA